MRYTRLQASLAASALMILGLGIFGVVTIRTVSRSLDTVVNTTAQELVALTGMQQAANRLSLEATIISLTTTDSNTLTDFQIAEAAEYEQAVADLQHFVDVFTELEADNDEQDEVEAIADATQALSATTDQLMALAEAQDTDAVLTIITGDLQENEARLDLLLEEIIEEEEAKLAADSAAAQRSITAGTIITIISTLAGVVLLYFLFHSLEAQAEEREINAMTLAEQNYMLQLANDELAEARRQADNANRTKSEFLATMSHELRTPLNAIIGYSQMLVEGIVGTLQPTQAEYIDRIFSNGRTLMHQINDVLDIAKIEAGRMDIVEEPFELEPWFDNIVRETQGLAVEKDLILEAFLDERLPESIIGDRDRLKQIALNLLSNAIKFTEEGSVTFSIQKRSKGTWSVSVTDTGIGIASHVQEYIFDEFRQADGTSTRQFGGTGLGLAIVRKLSMLMGGNVQLKSELGEGSQFTVTLPLTEVAPAPTTAPSAVKASV